MKSKVKITSKQNWVLSPSWIDPQKPWNHSRCFKIVATILMAIAICPMFTSCFRSYEVQGFSSETSEFNWGSVGAKLIGKEKNIRNTAVLGSPYELFIWFDSTDSLSEHVNISQIKLIYQNNNKIAFERNNVFRGYFKQKRSVYSSYFSIKYLDLEYLDMILLLDFTLKRKNKLTQYKVKIFLNKEHEKFRRIIGV